MSPHYLVKCRARSPDQSFIVSRERWMALKTAGSYVVQLLAFQMSSIARYGDQLDLGQ